MEQIATTRYRSDIKSQPVVICHLFFFRDNGILRRNNTRRQFASGADDI